MNTTRVAKNPALPDVTGDNARGMTRNSQSREMRYFAEITGFNIRKRFSNTTKPTAQCNGDFCRSKRIADELCSLLDSLYIIFRLTQHEVIPLIHDKK